MIAHKTFRQRGELRANTLAAVGKTPLARLAHLGGDQTARIFAKLEFLNPSGSIKDRIAVAMIDAAERDGLLAPGAMIVEPTSGNTGTSLAMVAAVRGYRCTLVVPQKTSLEKIATMQSYGASVVVAESTSFESAEYYTALAARIARETPGAFMPDQYSNPANARAHELTTGAEIWEQTGGEVTHVVAGIGTGGTICGIARALKARSPHVCIVGVDPVGSVYSGGAAAPYELEGIGRHYFPKSLDLSLIDRIERVGDAEAFAMARAITRDEGIFAGGSGGAAMVAASRIAPALEADSVIVVILPDSGHLYLSKFYNDDWLAERGLTIT